MTTSTYGQATTTYDYNGLGQLIRRGNTYCYSGHCQLLEERSSPTGPVTQWYVHGSQGVDDLPYRNVSGAGRWVVPDANQNTVTQFDSSGNVLNRFVYDAYGAPKQLSADWLTWQSITEDLHLFTGRFYQRTHAQYDHRNRFYDPEVEKFTSRDPIGLWANGADFGNSYLYVVNDPANRVDPSGLDDSDEGRTGRGHGLWRASEINQAVREHEAALGITAYRVDIHTGRKYLVCGGNEKPNRHATDDRNSSIDNTGETVELNCINYCQDSGPMGHAWLEASSYLWSEFKSWGFWGNGLSCGIPSIEPSQRSKRGDNKGGNITDPDPYGPGGNKRTPKTTTCYTVILDKDCATKQGWGPNTRPTYESPNWYLPTCKAIASCLRNKIREINQNEWKLWYNCRDAAQDLLKKCCVKASK